ncbi:9746_t:CDS:2 [Cetraspora pellucida]|uniref:9746_t:CDS:1 n=1 Tax=Cetraspora pellucida TaxID=1433469 RepID=A0A9N9HAA6_9GLOM|nr:9746_t:CDS:2 [Cetraspora pellucida]
MKFLTVISACLVLSLTINAAPMGLEKRRFGQEHTPAADATFQEIKDIAQGTGTEAQAGNLSGAMVRALLAKAPACDQQDRADEIIDLAEQLGGNKKKQLIKLAKTYRQLERNTPNAGQPSELCKEKPRHKELNGLKQAQDPTGSPKSSDPKTGDPKASDPTTTVGGEQFKMPKITKDGAQFVVNGNKFQNLDAAHGRQCDIQFNGGDRSFSGADCDNQTNVCKSGAPIFG